MADKKTESIGRGGRGALLLAALSNKPRRPGESQETTEQPSEQKPLGRGAFLQSILSQGRGKITPVAQQQAEPPRFVGRGRGLALSSLGESSRTVPTVESTTKQPEADIKEPSVPRETSPVQPDSVKNVKPSTSPTILASKVEELSIGRHSGTSGTKLSLEVNYVRLKVLGNEGIYEYHVSFNPVVDSKNMRFRLVNQQPVRDITGNVKNFDGAKMYLPRRLAPVSEVVVNMPTNNAPVTVSIKYIKVCQTKDLIHLYNVLFKKVMHVLNMTQVGRNYYDPKANMLVPQHKLEVWPGYVTAVQEYEGGTMLNCDCSFRVLRTTTAYDMMQGISKYGKNIKEAVTKALVGLVALTRYNNKTYRIDDIAWDMNPESTFTLHSGVEERYVDYYKRVYDLDIKDTSQPLLINRPKRKAMETGKENQLICLIPEFCYMTGLTDEMRNDFKVMKDVAVHTRVTPEKRQFALQKFIDNIANTPKATDCFRDWNLELDIKPMALDGRLLKAEELIFGGNKVKVSPEADWGRQATGNKCLVAVNFDSWVIVFTKRDTSRAMEFTKTLRNVCPSMGINVKEPMRIEIHNDRTETYCEALKEAIKPTVQIIVVIFPTLRDDRYSAVKKLCCIDMPVPSQCMNSKTISDPRKLRSVVQKIALQMNCKLGGELWGIHIPIDNLMICGLDTYHDVSRGKKSVLAFVASMNKNRTRWFSMTAMQRPGQEAGDSLKILFISALRKYFECNHTLPEKIVLFRDGVGDGQIDFISKYEVEQLTSCYRNFSEDYCPTLSVVIVQKRINTRMYAVQRERGRETLANPPPGSIVDHSVTRKSWYDYFLVSQHVRQGTVTPTHYVVIYDTSNLKAEHMQRLTYKMTHMYYNWPGTIRVPAPCQYAHKLAYLVGQNLHKETHCDLADRLFYL